MIISVTELRNYITTNETDTALEARLQGLESLIRAYTHNNFQIKNFRSAADIVDGALVLDVPALFSTGDTIQITQSKYNDGLYSRGSETGLIDEEGVLVTKVVYPPDLKMGAVNLMKWDIENRNKVGISSETISRHSVTYSDPSGDNSTMGFPKGLMGFLEPYRRARF